MLLELYYVGGGYIDVTTIKEIARYFKCEEHRHISFVDTYNNLFKIILYLN